MKKLSNNEILANNLQYYLKQSGKTQKEMAEIVGVSAPTFHEWISGKKYPRIEKLEKLANYFGIRKTDLIEENTVEPLQPSSCAQNLDNSQSGDDSQTSNANKKVASIKDRLKDAMKAAGKTQADLARNTGLSTGSISHYLSGSYEPKQDAINKIAIALNVSEKWLCGYDVPQNNDTKKSVCPELLDTHHLDLIVPNGTVKIPSIFLFEYCEDVTIFLHLARKANCTVIFENEGITVVPDSDDFIIRAKIQAFSSIISCREIGNAYVRFLGNTDKLSWKNVKTTQGEQ